MGDPTHETEAVEAHAVLSARVVFNSYAGGISRNVAVEVYGRSVGNENADPVTRIGIPMKMDGPDT